MKINQDPKSKNYWVVILEGRKKLRYCLVIVLKFLLESFRSVQLSLMLGKNKIRLATNLQAKTDMSIKSDQHHK